MAPTTPGRRALLAAALSAPLVATAQAPSDAAPSQRVEITSTPAADSGRDDTVTRALVTREDIARYGDASLSDVLRRVPGITVTGTAGRAPEIRLRGLGSGYTRILINGEPAPAGFSIDSLAPSQVERIEVSQVGKVDSASQAIAGTLNIVLRTQARRGVRQLDAGLASRDGRASASLDGLLSDRRDEVSYSIGFALARRNERWRSSTFQQASDTGGAPMLERFGRRGAYGLTRSAGLTPKLTWTPGEADQLSVEGLFRRNLFDDRSTDARDTLLGAPPTYSTDWLETALRTTLAQGRVQWKHVFGEGASLDTRLGANTLRRESASRFEGRDELDRVAMQETVDARVRESGVTTAAKLRLPYAADHAVALGWDSARTVRREVRVQHQSSPTGRPVVDADESYTSTLTAPAVYAQDEWDVDPSLSAYVGLRVAALHTRTEGSGLAPTGTRSSVISPVLQLMKKLGEAGEDRLRLGLSRTYKAPRAADLNPRRFVAVDNSPATPDLQGNPGLKPELAWGLDVAWEGLWAGRAGSWNTSLTARRIRDVIVERVQSEAGLWVARKENLGSASVYGFEAGLRWRTRAAEPAAADLEWRASVARNWSRVARIPGPDNRLDGQVPLSAQWGLDWKSGAGDFSAGGSFAYRGSARTRTSATQVGTAGLARTLDLYALWRAGAGVQWRLALANALAQREATSETLDDETGHFRQEGTAFGSRTLRLGLELKL